MLTSQNVFSQSDYTITKYFKSIEACPDSNIHWEDMECTFVRIEYPVFNNPKYSNTLNQLIKSTIHSFFSEKYYNNFDDFSEQFFQDYWKTQMEMHTPHWSNDIKVEIIENSIDFISMKLENINYMGGAHGGFRVRTLNFSKEMNYPISLNDIFDLNPKCQVELNRIFNIILRNQYKYSDNENYIKDIDFFDQANYYCDDISQRFLLDKNSLVLYLDYYDELEGTRIGMRINEIRIPINKLSHLIKINCPLNFMK